MKLTYSSMLWYIQHFLICNVVKALNLIINIVAEIRLPGKDIRLLTIPQSSAQRCGMVCHWRFLSQHVKYKCSVLSQPVYSKFPSQLNRRVKGTIASLESKASLIVTVRLTCRIIRGCTLWPVVTAVVIYVKQETLFEKPNSWTYNFIEVFLFA